MNDYRELHELYHYGIKNMKWGNRRYQNEDGSLTPLGRDHYGYGNGGVGPDRSNEERFKERMGVKGGPNKTASDYFKNKAVSANSGKKPFLETPAMKKMRESGASVKQYKNYAKTLSGMAAVNAGFAAANLLLGDNKSTLGRASMAVGVANMVVGTVMASEAVRAVKRAKMADLK